MGRQSTLFPMERAAFSIRGIARRYGVGRGTVADAIQKGDLPAARLGPRHTVVLVHDFERWLRQVVGDDKLADQIATVNSTKRKLKGEALRKRILTITERRLKQLKKITDEDSTTLKKKET